MPRRYDTVSFLSDLGTRDESVGVVKAVLADLAPHVRVLDLTHEIPPFDTRAGSLALARAVPYVPSGVVLAVVDPGVGTSRRALAIEVAGGEGVFVGPDNGLLAPAIAMAGGAERCVVLSNEAFHLPSPSATCAARDVFAPAAAHLCSGVDLAELGDAVDADELLPGVVPLPRDEGDTLVCEVLWVDRFGNCQLNVGPDDIAHLGARVRVLAGDPAGPSGPVVRVAARVRTYADVGVGAVGLVDDASGMVSLVLDRRAASEELAIDTGSQVVLAPLGDDAGGVTSPVQFRPR
ncbi:MAG: SAM-dependent chlorinase/fluorinase [Acidimicrobiales bacterium]|nr:SAM-dependent chlorinase/fluorinase [Acidimicrobiales bacterium]MCB9392638.1 SAM-dependent chlorinase/fluorinase [Acidimicrobiaceae bacterium]